MKNRFLVYFLALITFLSCKNQQEEVTELNTFLQTNYKFNNRTLNQFKGAYYLIIEEQPSRKIEKLNELDSKFELLISDIENAITNKESNLENITSEYREILNEIPKIVNNRKDYLLPEFNLTKSESRELSLNYMKNRLVIAMSYAFEYRSRLTYVADGLNEISVKSYFSKTNENGIKLTLTSKYGQSIKENRHIIINKIEHNGKDKNVDYKLKDNFSFTDIEFDTLENGIYRVNGILRFYERDGKIDIPFNEQFEVE